MNIVLIGASISNLYAAKKLSEKHTCTIYEREKSIGNPQTRLLPNSLLYRIGFINYTDEKSQYVNLLDIKKKLISGLNIIYNSDAKADFQNEKLSLNNQNIAFDFAIINTRQTKINQKFNKFLVYDYTIEPSGNHYSGRSLQTAIDKVDEILSKFN